MKAVAFLSLVLSLPLAGCGGDDTGTDAGPFADADGTEDSGERDGAFFEDGAVAGDGARPDGSSDGIVLTQLRAFPTAEGYGAGATGGRGGTILYVTTTEDTDEAGSFRWALQQDYPQLGLGSRIRLFEA